MQLPTSVINADRIDPKVLLLYGPPKTGKTTIVSKLPNHLLIDLEEGSDYVSACKVKCPDLGTLDTIVEKINEAKNPYKFVIIDTIDKVEEWCERDATKKYRATLQGKNLPPSQSVLNLPNGGGYLWLRQSFISYFNKLSMLARHVILVGHIRDKMIESSGKEVSAKDLDLTGKIKSIACSKADAICYFNRLPNDKAGGVFLTFETSETVNCGSRCEHLKGKKFEFPGGIEGFNWEVIYKELGKKVELQDRGLENATVTN